MSRTIRGAIKDYAAKTADIGVMKVIRPLTNFIWLVKKPGCPQPIAVGSGQGGASYAPGSSVYVAMQQGSRDKVIVSLPPPGRRGASLFPTDSLGSANYDIISIVYADPATYPIPCSSYPITIYGSGFNETPVDEIIAVRWNQATQEWEPDLFVAVDSVTWISEEELVIEISCIDAAPDAHMPSFLARRS